MTLSDDWNAIRYIYGLDLASGSGQDYTGITIQSLGSPTREEPRPLPRLADLYRVKLPLDQQLDMFTKQLFPKYPPYYIVSDYTNEKTFTDMLIRDYGDDMVEGIVFGAGSGGTKKQLKDDGAFLFKQGYKFPAVENMRNREQAELVTTLIEELRHEEMRLTPAGKESFDHPRGRHNDMAISWELSAHGCLKFMLNAAGAPVTTSSEFHDVEDDYTYSQNPKIPTVDDLIPELRNGRFKINDVRSTL